PPVYFVGGFSGSNCGLFQAARGIRDGHVTGVETWALRLFLAAQDEFLDLVGDDSDEASRLRTQYKRMVRKATHLQRCGPDCVQVEIDVPAAASNPNGHDYFRLGTKTYPPGRYTVYACRAREVADPIARNGRVHGGRRRGP